MVFLLIYFFFRFGFSRCDKALPAAVFELLPVRLSRNTLEAALAALLEVTFFAILPSHRDTENLHQRCSFIFLLKIYSYSE